MKRLVIEIRSRLARGEGFALPAVIFALVLMSTVAVAALLTAGDEQLSSRAVRESSGAFYAAEAGLNVVWAAWPDSLVDLLEPGDSTDLGWQTLDNGASYRGVIQRYDNGGQPVYGLRVEGRGAGPLGGQRVLSFALTRVSTSVTLNVPGAFNMAGNATIGDDGGVVVDGNDNIPPGWTSCDPPGPAVPGMTTPDAAVVELNNSPTVTGDPPILEEPFDTQAFDSLFAALVAQADIVFPPGVLFTAPAPVENPPGVCDTSVPTNWGAPTDPSHPCFDYHPIIYVPGGVETSGGVGQGILLNGSARHAGLDGGFIFYGLIMSESWVELENGASLYGASYSKANDNEMHGGSSARYSSCALNRAAAAIGGGGGGDEVKPLSSRAFAESLR